MKFKLPFEIPASDLQLNAHSKIAFMGSCFADNISQKIEELQLRVLKNPFGTIFHPIPIGAQLKAAINEHKNVNVLKRGDVYLDWLSSSKIAAPSKQELMEKIFDQREITKSFLSEADLLVVSFGTAWGYFHKECTEIVANCHKQPNSKFEKQLTNTEEMLDFWGDLIADLRKLYPSLKVVLTVSPVRHVKDGLVENNRSKARIIEFVHRLCEETTAIYFPAYEILIDELRDHRFYAEDLVHPNNTAIDYIFNKFIDFAYSDQGKDQLMEIKSYINLRDHRAINDFSQEESKRQLKLNKMRDKIRFNYNWMK